MSEGPLHRLLVRSLAGRISSLEGREWLLFIDGDGDGSLGCPPQLAAVRPDLYARDRRSRHVIVGEAKIDSDIDTIHTVLQLTEYFIHLRDQPSGELHITVPYSSAGRAHRVCRAVRRATKCDHIPIEVSGWMFGRSQFVEVWRA